MERLTFYDKSLGRFCKKGDVTYASVIERLGELEDQQEQMIRNKKVPPKGMDKVGELYVRRMTNG